MAEMKDSGIEWIGEIPAHWRTPRLRSKYAFGKGLAITKADLTDSGVPIISYGQIHSKDNIGVRICDKLIRFVPDKFLEIGQNSVLHEGDLLFADTSEDLDGCGNSVYIDRSDLIFAGYHTLYLRPKSQKAERYYAYLFASDAWRAQVRSEVSGVKLFSITQDILKNTVLLEPTEDEQIRIVAYLDKKCSEIDTLIAAKEKANTLLKERRQSIIYEAVTKGLNPDAPMKDSGVEWIGEIPEGWSTLRLRFLGDFQNGISKAGEYFGSGFPFVSYGDVYKNDVLPPVPSGLVRSTPEEQKVCSVEKGDIFFTRTSETKEEIGLTAVCCETIPNATFAGFLIRFRPSTNLVSTEFLRYYFSCGLQREYFAKEMTLVTRASLGQDLLKNMTVLVPSREEQETIVEYLNKQTQAIELSIEQNCVLIKQLKEYRQSIIYEAVTGKIEV